MSNDTQPEIRFPGFTEAWEQRKLGDEFEKVNERNDGSFGKDKWISVAKMYFQDPEKVQSNNIDTRTYVMRLGDIAFEGHPNADFKFGRFVVNDIGEGVVSELFPIYRHKQEYDNNYWKYAIQLERIMAPIFAKSITSSGNSSNKLYPKHFLRQRVSVASIDEQHKIGDFLLTIDRTITLHQRKLDLLKETKKGFLQKMFPKNGAKVPEIRFPGFTGDWEQRKLGDAADIVGGGTPSTANPEYWDGDIDWYAPAEIGEQIYVSKSQRTITELGQQKSSAKILPVGTVLFTSRAGIGNTAILAKEATTNQGFQSIVPHKDKLDSYFIFSRTNELKRYGEVTGAGSTFVEVSGKQMAKMPLLIPSIAEQRQIGSFFKQLDNTITLHQRKLDLLKETKKGFLQKMFV
ncbi:restriction endonuclease subunit S [Enterococcus hirae]|uniref:restriction endonuclease subunit S n=1 Tax=Enterococcus hirae TaxID=1354 RepID=UPI0021E873E6|nr:restriction endonuclease subunit S [Enterococcus hirae]MCV3107440.1 restriction endonuclease subunit S [Enterococcus hirae]MCV3129980.1 restriction endonuclease subunit S [Enterococcus hirae]MCV3132435.1 restriction endonuclease subunit S [Enterococcus hirae]WGF41710.1 restriction endonuclease subunit S [Enterococcus hirae]